MLKEEEQGRKLALKNNPGEWQERGREALEAKWQKLDYVGRTAKGGMMWLNLHFWKIILAIGRWLHCGKAEVEAGDHWEIVNHGPGEDVRADQYERREKAFKGLKHLKKKKKKVNMLVLLKYGLSC